MGIFGWYYPAGCKGTPFDDLEPCEVCGKDVDKEPEKGGCDCPVCPECGAIGDPACEINQPK